MCLSRDAGPVRPRLPPRHPHVQHQHAGQGGLAGTHGPLQGGRHKRCAPHIIIVTASALVCCHLPCNLRSCRLHFTPCVACVWSSNSTCSTHAVPLPPLQARFDLDSLQLQANGSWAVVDGSDGTTQRLTAGDLAPLVLPQLRGGPANGPYQMMVTVRVCVGGEGGAVGLCCCVAGGG